MYLILKKNNLNGMGPIPMYFRQFINNINLAGTASTSSLADIVLTEKALQALERYVRQITDYLHFGAEHTMKYEPHRY